MYINTLFIWHSVVFKFVKAFQSYYSKLKYNIFSQLAPCSFCCFFYYCFGLFFYKLHSFVQLREVVRNVFIVLKVSLYILGFFA